MRRVIETRRVCVKCGKKFRRTRGTNGRLEKLSDFFKRKYCSAECYHAKDEITEHAYRERARKLRGRFCARCGSTENLHAHHLDHDITNNDPENILTLCKDCHELIHLIICRIKREIRTKPSSEDREF